MADKGVFGRLDYSSLALMALLSVLGLFLIRAATAHMGLQDPLYFVKHQMIWIVAGTVALLVAVAIPYANIVRWSKYLYWINLALLAVVLVKGHTALGASRWIAVGPFQVQPSEIAKILIIITLANHLNQKTSLTRWRDLISPIVHVAVPMVLIIKQPDLGTSLVFGAILVAMLYMAGVPAWKLGVVFGGGLALVVFWIYAHFHFMIGHHHIPIFMHSYQLQRLLIFLNPGKDPLGAGFNVIQSRIAVGTGGLWGAGLLSGHVGGQLSFLPESYTDFIFAVIGNELGFVGSIAVLFLYFMLLIRGLYIAANAKDRLGLLLATGVVAMYGFHVLESAGMATGIMPVAGVPLPFISYGGSAYLTDAVGMGILMNVYARRQNLMFRASGDLARYTRGS